MAKRKSKRPWHKALFDKFYYEFAFEKRDDSRTRKEVDFVKEMMGLTGRERILDLCCGPGRQPVLRKADAHRLIVLARKTLDRRR
ncbi:MAG: hypothetical protein GXP25_04725 [Planctomycetes bacterium]|nr:hypothetical protein [Planctomycetota bacterium]